jgi:hypothetical protein
VLQRKSRERGRENNHSVTFRQCPWCSYDFVTHTGEKACHMYACPYLPDELDVSCPNCNYNFATGEGRPECSDPPTCEFSQREAPGRVAALEQWVQAQSAGKP